MWLLTQSKTPPNNLVKPDDTSMLNYETILYDTNAVYQNNDPNTRRPKSSTGAKYNNIIKPMWVRRIKKNTLEQLKVIGAEAVCASTLNYRLSLFG
jgi:hypothetical protein